MPSEKPGRKKLFSRQQQSATDCRFLLKFGMWARYVWWLAVCSHSGIRRWWSTVASPAMGHRGTCPPSTNNNFIFSSLWSKSIQVLCILRDQLVQLSTTHSSFDQYCISHKTISYRAAAALKPWSPPWVPHDIVSIFAFPRNESWRRHWWNIAILRS